MQFELRRLSYCVSMVDWIDLCDDDNKSWDLDYNSDSSSFEWDLDYDDDTCGEDHGHAVGEILSDHHDHDEVDSVHDDTSAEDTSEYEDVDWDHDDTYSETFSDVYDYDDVEALHEYFSNK
ncbi:unnamed protein product [Microthlaspi erraticum]|uniref:Uncharacterized protein n=1 Tax=Microthlaspi erraticum TaxID=1685480 RepID=A0A6D2JDK7_9BRAS|nr:unnamed protein product [Microthlaspi erraticum]